MSRRSPPRRPPRAAIEASPSRSPSPPPPAVAGDLANLQLPPATTGDDPTTFAQLNLSPKTAAAIAEMGFTTLTPIQQKSIPPILAGRDVLGAAKTGSGKTLAFLLPAIEMMQDLRFKPRNGTGVIVVSPTRELALQMFGVAREIMGTHSQTCGIVMGGANRSAEATKLATGINLLIATPGRLLDHLKITKGFVYKNLRMLVIDEADRILDAGFEDEMRAIVKILPESRQTALFSATQTTKVEDLARVSLRPGPLYVNVEEETKHSTVEGLEQGYIVCPSELRFRLLFTVLKKHLAKKKKIIVFVSSCNCVKYYEELLNYIDLPVLALHGQQKQQKRTANFFSFVNATEGVLICTDVAARGLDIPAVDWIIQFDAPDEPRNYIHRVGPRLASSNTSPPLRVPLVEHDLTKLINIQAQLEKLISSNYYLNRTAKEGFRSYRAAYAAHSLRTVFDVQKLDLAAVARSFGFTTPPKVDIVFGSRMAKDKRPVKRRAYGSQPRQKA
ncbi:hypothetical protein VE04_08077 [Pseudogymnoascus sp. 24MN13]|nr:hypothetical protein VE04_08077 [Pseudogymnoascus sp. 24MN13]